VLAINICPKTNIHYMSFFSLVFGLAECLPGSEENRRNDVQCQHRWLKVLDPSLQKGAWKKEVTTFAFPS